MVLMANADVSELMLDPDFVDPIEVLRNGVSVGTDGLERITSPTSFNEVVGSVQPAAGKDLAQLPEAERVEGTLSIWTSFRLTERTETTQADIVLWQGQHHRVVKILSWSHYGTGYCQALMQQTELVAGGPF